MDDSENAVFVARALRLMIDDPALTFEQALDELLRRDREFVEYLRANPELREAMGRDLAARINRPQSH